MTIRGIIFDYGNVLCQPQKQSDVDAMADCLGVAVDSFTKLYWQFREAYDLAVLDGDAYWSNIAKMASVTLSSDQVESLIRFDSISWSRPNTDMARWVDALRAHGLQVAILSNMPTELRDYISSMTWLPQFDHYTYSCDIRTAKPDPDIYHHCVKGLALKPDDVLFLDDRPANVEAGRRLGIEGIVFENARELNPLIKQKGLPEIQFSE